MKKNVLLTGGTGFVGKQLTNTLIANGFSVSILSRNFKENSETISYFKWDVESQTIDEQAILNADYIIHLAGENIGAKRWSAKQKKLILDSREQSTKLLYSAIKKTNKKIEAFISASGVGIYGAITDDVVCTENTPAANDFLGTVCHKWESATEPIKNLGIRTVQIRTGLVLGKNDGIIKQLTPLFRLRLGTIIGSGNQYMPWIHIDDLCSIYLMAILNQTMQGAYNAAIDDKTNAKTFYQTLAKVFGYRIYLPNIPSFIIKLILGEMAQIVLTGRRISPKKIENLGFHFLSTDLERAYTNCLKKSLLQNNI